jgi:hypothetical protein
VIKRADAGHDKDTGGRDGGERREKANIRHGGTEAGRMFFFEKKNQKTFASSAASRAVNTST